MQRLLWVGLVASDLASDRLNVVQRRNTVAGDIVKKGNDILALKQMAQGGDGVQHGGVDRHAPGDRITLKHFPGQPVIAEHGFSQGGEFRRRDDVGNRHKSITVEGLAPLSAHLACQSPPPPATHQIG